MLTVSSATFQFNFLKRWFVCLTCTLVIFRRKTFKNINKSDKAFGLVLYLRKLS